MDEERVLTIVNDFVCMSPYHASLNVFKEYVSHYDMSDERIALKIRHTYKVADLCREIARREGFSSVDVELAWLCGLLHDIGRFEQLRRWNTFNDGVSCSHALLGVEVLEEQIFNYNVNDEWLDIIFKTVAHHSDLILPEDLSPRVRRFCAVVRDADKIDILRVFSESSCEAVLEIEPDDFAAGEISDVAMMGFGERRCLARHERPGNLDGLVGAVCLVFELEAPSAREVLCGRGYLQCLLDSPFGLTPAFYNPLTRQRWGIIREAMPM